VANKGYNWDRVLLFAYHTTVQSSKGETPVIWKGFQATNWFELLLSLTKKPVIYSDYGTTLFKELKMICELARKSIQQAQSTKKKNKI